MFNDLVHVLLLRDYNTRLVVGSTALLGMTAGVIGSFLLLRKRSLMGDALSHATLPGICFAFLLMTIAGWPGKSLPGLLLGAIIFGMVGVGCVLLIRKHTRLKDDAAMGIVLSVFFGLGIALLGMIQDLPAGSAAGLESFIYGKTASMVWSDFLLIVAAAGAVLIVAVLLFKEFKVLCFDADFAGAQGWPVGRLDIFMLALVAVVTVIGLQAVGLILIIALLITPPAAARFWTDRLILMIVVAGLFGAAAGWIGSSWSALATDLPAGAMIVLVAAGIFGLSMVFGGRRGVLVRGLQRWRLARTVARQHLLRAMYEIAESENRLSDPVIKFDELVSARSWSKRTLRRVLRSARHAGLIARAGAREFRLTERGHSAAARGVRNHRLWEMYLIAYADIAPSHVDRDADQIEHVLQPQMIRRLERLLMGGDKEDIEVPASPHG